MLFPWSLFPFYFPRDAWPKNDASAAIYNVPASQCLVETADGLNCRTCLDASTHHLAVQSHVKAATIWRGARADAAANDIPPLADLLIETLARRSHLPVLDLYMHSGSVWTLDLLRMRMDVLRIHVYTYVHIRAVIGRDTSKQIAAYRYFNGACVKSWSAGNCWQSTSERADC